MSKTITKEQISELAEAYKIPLAMVQAIYQVEAAGKGFLADGRPKILFERHKFSKFTNGIYDVTFPDISNKKPGGYKGGAGEWARFDKAVKLKDGAYRNQAIMATSWGAGQVMGFHYKMLGFATPQDMVNAAFESEARQFKMMLDFIKATPSVFKAMQDPNPDLDTCRTIAAGYNGQNYEINNYHTKIWNAYQGFSTLA